jgi:hypothetical protein
MLLGFLRGYAPPASWGSRAAVLAWTATPDRLEIGEDVAAPGDLANVDEDELLRVMADELEACETPIEIVLAPATALHVAGLLQLALRHPVLRGRSRALADSILRDIRTYFAEAPAVLEALRRGDDPARDRPADEGES